MGKEGIYTLKINSQAVLESKHNELLNRGAGIGLSQALARATRQLFPPLSVWYPRIQDSSFVGRGCLLKEFGRPTRERALKSKRAWDETKMCLITLGDAASLLGVVDRDVKWGSVNRACDGTRARRGSQRILHFLDFKFIFSFMHFLRLASDLFDTPSPVLHRCPLCLLSVLPRALLSTRSAPSFSHLQFLSFSHRFAPEHDSRRTFSLFRRRLPWKSCYPLRVNWEIRVLIHS